MLDMSNWPRRPFNVTRELRLDPKNVRLGLGTETDPPQGAIIQNLFQFEGAFEIARSIVTVGFLTHELPVVLQEDGTWLVVEGNRRAAAIKALHNPHLVPGFQRRLTDLIASSPLPDTIDDIECLVAPDRDSANRLIATLHTSNPRKPWGPLRQAEFFAAQLQSGKTAKELIAEYPGIDVREFIETAEMYKLLQTTDYKDDDLAHFVRRRNFPISVFERLYKNDEFLELAKIGVASDTGHVTLKGGRSDFDKLAIKVVKDIKSKRIDTRVLNKPEADPYKAYMAELQPFAVRSKKSREAVLSMPAPAAPAPTARVPQVLDTSGLHPVPGCPAIERILAELSSIHYRDFPNAAFDLIRTFIEKSVKAYAVSIGEVIPPGRAGGFVYLDDCLSWLEAEVRKHKKSGLVGVIQKLRSNKNVNQYRFTKAYLDAANHNHDIFIEKDDVKDLWDSVNALLRFVLRDRSV